jgi:hypothetical protein
MRCWLRLHPWIKWETVSLVQNFDRRFVSYTLGSGPNSVLGQKRTCRRCNKIEIRELTT